MIILTALKTMDNQVGKGRADRNHGKAYHSLSDFQEVIDYEKHLNIAIEIGDRVGEGEAYENLGSRGFPLTM